MLKMEVTDVNNSSARRPALPRNLTRSVCCSTWFLMYMPLTNAVFVEEGKSSHVHNKSTAITFAKSLSLFILC